MYVLYVIIEMICDPLETKIFGKISIKIENQIIKITLLCCVKLFQVFYFWGKGFFNWFFWKITKKETKFRLCQSQPNHSLTLSVQKCANVGMITLNCLMKSRLVLNEWITLTYIFQTEGDLLLLLPSITIMFHLSTWMTDI